MGEIVYDIFPGEISLGEKVNGIILQRTYSHMLQLLRETSDDLKVTLDAHDATAHYKSLSVRMTLDTRATGASDDELRQGQPIVVPRAIKTEFTPLGRLPEKDEALFYGPTFSNLLRRNYQVAKARYYNSKKV